MPANSMALSLMASTFVRLSRFIPAMPRAKNKAPILVRSKANERANNEVAGAGTHVHLRWQQTVTPERGDHQQENQDKGQQQNFQRNLVWYFSDAPLLPP